MDIIAITICEVACGADSWVDIEEFVRAKESWLKTLVKLPKEIASHDKGKPTIHMVSAWASQNHLVLGLAKVSDLSNEMTAIPEQIINAGAQYVLSVKSNQGKHFGNIKDAFGCGEHDGFVDVEHSYHEVVSKGHGRLHTRGRWVITDRDELACVDEDQEWKGLSSFVKVCYNTDGVDKVESRCYISSMRAKASKLLGAVRGHCVAITFVPGQFHLAL